MELLIELAPRGDVLQGARLNGEICLQLGHVIGFGAEGGEARQFGFEDQHRLVQVPEGDIAAAKRPLQLAGARAVRLRLGRP